MSIDIKTTKEEYWCVICQDLAVIPYVTVPCQHLYCKGCIEKIFPGPCAACRLIPTCIMHDRAKETQMMTSFNEMPYKCTICDKTHPYRDAKMCATTQRFLYYGYDARVTSFRPSVVEGIEEKVLLAGDSVGMAAYAGCQIPMEKTGGIHVLHLFDQYRKPVGFMMIEEKEHAFDVLKGQKVYLYKYSDKTFRREDKRLVHSAHRYLSTVLVDFIECIEVKDAYIAMQNDPCVFMISFNEKIDILGQFVADKIVKAKK